MHLQFARNTAHGQQQQVCAEGQSMQGAVKHHDDALKLTQLNAVLREQLAMIV